MYTRIIFSQLLLLLSASFISCGGNPTPSHEKSDTAMLTESPSIETSDTTITIAYLTGHFNPAKHPYFVTVPSAYTDHDGDYYLRKDTWAAFQKMADAAAKDGIQLIIRSATRNFARQKQIWEGKWKGNRKIENGKNASIAYPDPKTRALKILEYSSMPSTSRHHWGTDMDLNNFTNAYFETGEGKKIYDWLQLHGAGYGFCQPYTPKGADRPYGYNEEKWHWSYMPVAKKLLHLAKDQFTNSGINGFLGAETAIEIDVVKKYVLGVNKACF